MPLPVCDLQHKNQIRMAVVMTKFEAGTGCLPQENPVVHFAQISEYGQATKTRHEKMGDRRNNLTE